MSGKILLVSGPSGSGKSTLIKKLMKDYEGKVYFSISSTTRNIRNDEQDGVNYFFINEEEFKNDISKGLFLEWAKVHNNYYGTSIKQVKRAFEENKIVILDIDVQGFHLAKEKFSNEITSVFITTPNKQELIKRLSKRGTDSNDVINKRVKNAEEEMSHINEYDYFIINDDFKKAYKGLKSIFKSMKYKINEFNYDKIVQNWINN